MRWRGLRFNILGLMTVVAIAAIALDLWRPEPVLTAEVARTALVELLRRDGKGLHFPHDPDEVARAKLTGVGKTTYECGGFRVDVARAKYWFAIRYGCVFEFEGAFGLEDGRWVALRPECTLISKVRWTDAPRPVRVGGTC
ncbi:MAG: hypothetical protein ACYC61_28765 [Isosphaeraceae bacterium]